MQRRSERSSKKSGAPRRSRAAAKPPTKRASRESGAALSDFCRALPGTTEDIKWGDNLIFSVGGKMFAGFEVDNEHEFAFKCDEDDFERLTMRTPGVVPAPYAARFLWVKVMKPGALKPAEARRLLTKAHALVAAALPAKKRRNLGLDEVSRPVRRRRGPGLAT